MEQSWKVTVKFCTDAETTDKTKPLNKHTIRAIVSVWTLLGRNGALVAVKTGFTRSWADFCSSFFVLDAIFCWLPRLLSWKFTVWTEDKAIKYLYSLKYSDERFSCLNWLFTFQFKIKRIPNEIRDWSRLKQGYFVIITVINAQYRIILPKIKIVIFSQKCINRTPNLCRSSNRRYTGCWCRCQVQVSCSSNLPGTIDKTLLTQLLMKHIHAIRLARATRFLHMWHLN